MAAKKPGASAIFWWIAWILLTIGSFFVSCYFWTGFIARRFGAIQQPGVSVLWVAAVFGTWMVLLVPLIVVMYNKVDRAYEDARLRREKAAGQKKTGVVTVRSQLIEAHQRLLSKGLRDRLKKMPETVRRGHLMVATLRDGRKIENVFVADRKEVLGVYGLEKLSFDIQDIIDLEPADVGRLPHLNPEYWLRLDGVSGEVAAG